MKKGNIAAMFAVFTVAAFAASPGTAPKRQPHHVPDRLDKVRLISPAAEKSNHMLLVNVGGAIPPDVWPIVSTYAVSRLQINVWTNSAESVDLGALLANPFLYKKTFGSKACVAVFIEKSAAGAPIVCAPGYWSRVNLNGIDGDGADAQTLRDRLAKMILKGMAYACGGGASLDQTCSLHYSSLSLKGLDECGISISPTTYFPMLEILRRIGGPEVLSPARDDD